MPGSATKSAPMFSWWDIQDENARLPVKEASLSQIEQMFMPGRSSSSSSGSTDSAAKAAKGALKNLGKAMGAVAGGSDTNDHGPRVSVVAFKLLDLVKMNDDFVKKHGSEKVSSAMPAAAHRAPARAPAAARPAARPQARPQPTATPARAQPARTPAARPRPQQPAARPQEASLMDFGPSPTAGATKHGGLHHASSSPASFTAVNPNETRAERLKREYAAKKQKANRVWDDVDQRWVEVDAKAGVKPATSSAPPTAATSTAKKTVGISLDARNAVGKSHSVQAAVHKRVNEMKESQQKAVEEIRQREAQKKVAEAEEDAVRKRLEPKIKAWSEEHGKKKQLRALIGTLHTILWPDAKWKPVSLGDILDDSKCKKFYHKASRVVHPDKTGDLDAEKRFLAKRIFDALSQAKTEFDNGAR